MGRWAAINGITTGAKQVDIKADKGGGDLVQAALVTPPNEDSVPLPQDTAAFLELPGQGNYAAVGTVDKDAQFKAQPGEKRIYARSSVGAEACEVWLKKDGTISIRNDAVLTELRPDGSTRTANSAGFFELQADGTFNVNGVTIDPAGNLTSPAVIKAVVDVLADVISLTGHNHGPGSYNVSGSPVTGTSGTPQ